MSRVAAGGRVVSREQPVLFADDLGLLRGDGLFESLLVVDGQPQLLDEHLARMEQSAVVMDLPFPSAGEWRRSVDAAVRAWTGGPEMAVRLVLTRGTGRGGVTWYVLADPVNPVTLARRREGVAVLSLERGLDPGLADHAPWLLMGAKSLSYAVNMAAQRWARAHDADDVIFVAPGDILLEGTTSAVLIARKRKLLSPPASLGILPSITLRRLLGSAVAAGWEVASERLTVDDLHHADGVWLVSSILQAARVHTLNGTPLADSGLHGQICELVRSPEAVTTE